MIRQKLHFLGSVQGVGFRFTISRLAQERNITGWVKNEYDGTVRAEVQGEQRDIDSLLEEINHQRFIRIQRVDRVDIPVVKGERSFRTSYY